MRNNPFDSIVRNARQKRILKRVLSMLCVVVLLFTMHTLKRDANTLERIPMCGCAEHTHTPDCYEGDALVCGRSEHVHTDACYQEGPSYDELELEIGAPVVDLENTDLDVDLSLDENDFSLVTEDVAPAPVADAVGESLNSFVLGEETTVSRIIRALGLNLGLGDIAEVGIVDDGKTDTDLIGIEKTGDDYRIWARKNFAQLQLALILDNEIVTVRLLNGVAAPVEDAAATEDSALLGEVTPAEDAAQAEDVSLTGDTASAEDVVQVEDDALEIGEVPVEDDAIVPEQTEVEIRDLEDAGLIIDDIADEVVIPSGETQPEEEQTEVDEEIAEQGEVVDEEAAKPTDEAQGEEESGEEIADPSDETVEEAAEPTDETQGEEESGEEIADPSDETGEEAAEPTDEAQGEEESGEEIADPSDETVEEAAKPTDEAQGEEESGEEIADPSDETVEEAAKPTDEAQGEEESGEEIADPSDETGEEAAEPTDEAQGEEESGEEIAEPSDETGEEAAEPTDEAQGEEEPEEKPAGAGEEEADEVIGEEGLEDIGEQEPADEDAMGDEQEPVDEDAGDGESAEGEAPADQPAYAATIDLSEVVDYPLSLNALLSQAAPVVDVEAVSGAEAAEADADEATAWTIDYDQSLLTIEEAEGDYRVTPAQSFESTQITVDNGSRFALTLVNCALPEAEEAAAEPAQPEDERPVYAETIDLSEVVEYPLSLNALLSQVAPETAPAEAEAEEPGEAPAWIIDYDQSLLTIEEAEGDHLIMPIAGFESALVTVDNGSRYELTFVNCALPEAEEAAGQPETAYPAQDFEGHTRYMKVVVSAPEGAFPEGTTMAVADVEDEKTLTDIEDTVSEEFVEVKRVHAVDITFTDAEGNEIEPLAPISVVMRVEEMEQRQEAVVVHVDDAGATEVVESRSEAPAGETEVKVEMPATDAPTEEATEGEAQEGEAEESSVGFEADAFSVYAVVITESIETKYIDAAGATWNISVGYGPEAGIPAGATLAVEEVEGDYLEQTAELLKGRETITLARFFDITILDAEGNAVQPAQPVEVVATLAEQSEDAVKAVHFAEAGPEIIEASQEEDAVSFDAASFSVYGIVYTVDFHYGVDGQTYTFTLPGGGAVGMRELAPALGLVEDTEDAVDLFARSVENVAFSDESLVKAVPVDMNMTVGALKQKYELESEYSAELTEEQIAELNDKVLQAPDWALVSLKPFDTEETLTVALASGETFTVTVTDAQLTRTVITASGEAYEITVTYGENAAIPEGAELKVREILPEDEEYAGYLAAARRAASGEADAGEEAEADAEESEQPEADYARFFDIEIWADAQKVEPAAPVTVDIALADAPQTGEELKVVHFDEADGPVVMQTEAGEASEDEAVTEAAKVRFETDGFSVYGVIVSPHTPTGVNDLNGQMCTISHTKNGTTNYIKSMVLDETVDKLGKTTDQSKATVWQFESAGVAGQYYISTTVDGVKKYMHLDQADANNAHGTLGDTPQPFSVVDAGNGLYRLSAYSVDKQYYLNEFNGQNGFAGWYNTSDADDKMTLTFPQAMKNVEQYMLVTKYEDEYYIVLNDGRLEKVEDGLSGNPVGGDFTTPMTWTWDGSHLFHNSLATGYSDDQRASDYYRRYIDPQSSTGLRQEYGKYSDGTNVEDAPTENPTVSVTVSGDKGKYTYKTVTDRHQALMDTAFDITANGDSFKIHKNNAQYLGVTKDSDGNLRITGQQGAGVATDFWFADATKMTTGRSYAVMELVDYPQNGEQYCVLIKNNNGDYFIVNPDRSISQKHVASWDKSYTFAIPDKMQLWTYTDAGNKSQLSCTYNGKTWYLNPYQSNGITDYKADDNGYNHDGIYIDHSTHATNGNHQVRGTSERFFKIDNNLLKGGITPKDGYEVHLAKLTSASEMYYGDNGFEAERNHMVNHIDISIEGLTEVDVPLIYGTYLYRNPNQNDPSAADYYKTFTVTKSTDITLAQKVKITEDDIKRGTVEAFVRRKDANGKEYYDYRPDLFTITGYSANEKTEYSTDQVRIEGNFKVADIPPVTESERDSAATRKNRYDNRVYYTVSVNKPVTFQYIDPNMGQIYIYNDEGEIVPMEVTMDINFSASFNYWDWYGVGKQHNNECPPLQPGENEGNDQFKKWQGKDGKGIGGIGGWGNSGMDFVLGGDAGDAEANVVALNITKKIVDEQGNPISLAQPVDNDFKVYYNSNGDPCAVDGKAWRVGDEGEVANPINDSDSIYDGYKYLHTKSIRVGAGGMGLIYDYSVQPGMFYIQEDKDKLAQTVVDTKGQTWEYAKTYIETEYVWRTSGDTEEKRHVSQTYINKNGDYKSVPEVLGPYHRKVNGDDVYTNEEGKPLRNGFLVYSVYNVYKSKPINVEVEKKWQFGDEATDPLPNASMTVTLGRYRLTKDPTYTPHGTLTIEDSCSEIDNNLYDATYTVLGPNGYTQTVHYSSSGMTLTDLWAGEYTVVKIVPVKDNYLIDPLQETRFVTVPKDGEGTATFTTTHYQHFDSQNDIIKVGVAVGYPDNDFRVKRNPYNTKYVLTVPKNSTVQFSYDDFLYSNWGLQDDVKWAVYEWDNDQYDTAWKPAASEQPAPHGALQSVSVGDKDVCILILFHDENVAPAMNIRLKGAAANVQSNAMPMSMGRKLAGIAPNMSQNDSQGAPVSPVQGMKYELDQENGAAWARTVELSQSLGWERAFNEDFDEYAPDGYKYVYYIANVTEQNIPNGTQIQFTREYKRELIEGDETTPDKVKYTFTVTNKMPDKTKVRIKKVSELGDAITLGGAVFDLYKQNGSGYDKVQEGIVTGADGYSSEIEVSRGHYKLMETEAPSGYIKTGNDPEFDVTANANGEIVVTYKSNVTDEILVQNKPKGALKLTKVVTVNDEAPTTDAQKVLTNGIYEFNIVGSDAATSGQSHTVRISFNNGVENGYEIDGTPYYAVTGTDNTWTVLVPDLIPGQYTITETISDNPLMRFKSVTGGNGNAEGSSITVTVVAGDNTASNAGAQVEYTNNREVVDIDAAKTWTNKGSDVTTQLKKASVTFTLQSRSSDGDEWTDADVTAAANGNGATVELKTEGTASSDQSAWKVSWTNLPKYDEQNRLIQYQVVESQPKVGTDDIQLPAQASAVAESYGSVNGHANPTAQVSLTNPLPTTEITVKKTWSQSTNWPDAHIQVGMTLKANDAEATNLPDYSTTQQDTTVSVHQDAAVLLKAADAVNGHTWHNLPVYTDEGDKIAYTVEETGMKYKPDDGEAINLGESWKAAFTTNPSNYIGNPDGNGTVTIDNTPKETSINVTKEWTQNNVARTDKIDIGYELHKAGADDALTVDAANITVDKGDKEAGKVKYVTGKGWQTVTISKLPRYELVIGEESGTATATYSPVSYYVTETGVTGDTRVTYKANDGEETETASDANAGSGTITIYNRDAEVDINVLKVDATNASKRLKDAEFQILKFKDESAGYVAYDFEHKAFVTTVSGDASTQNAGDSSKQKTDANGRLSFTGLPAGQYKLVETKTPDGYIKVDNNGIFFTVSADGAVKWTKADGTEIDSNTAATDKPNRVEYNSTNKTFTVGNNPGASLPSTGGSGTTLYHVLGSLLMLAAAVLLVVKRRMRA